jgi:glycosyltransferase involved in cell wall biosynthesis
MREIVRHAENGFLVETLDEAAEAVHPAKTLDRAAVRASVEGRFGVDRMVDDYLALYRRVLELHHALRVGERGGR